MERMESLIYPLLSDSTDQYLANWKLIITEISKTPHGRVSPSLHSFSINIRFMIGST